MHYGLVSLDLYGHLNPMTTLGAELACRGHRVTLFGSSRGRPFAERSGLSWVPLNDTPENGAGWDRLGDLSGLAALKFTGGLIRQATLVTCRDLPGMIRSEQIDGLIVDQCSPAAAVVADRVGLPYAIACNAIAVHLHPSVPPVPMNWRHRPGFFGRIRNRLGNKIAMSLFNRFAGAGTSEGISPVLLGDLTRQWGAVMVAQQPACFDFPEQPRPAHFHYTAPWHRPGRDLNVEFPWERLDDRPLVFASMGTLQNKLRHVYAAIAEAARGLEVQIVLSLGSPGARLDLRPPENVIVVPFAPQLDLLDRAAAVITHAGLNTTLEALARGLPMLCLPVTNDQPGIARRVEYLNAGVVIGAQHASPKRIRRSLALIQTSECRMSAQRLGNQIRDLNGPAMAADIIQSAFGSLPFNTNATRHVVRPD